MSVNILVKKMIFDALRAAVSRARPLRSSLERVGEKPSRTIYALTQPMLLARWHREDRLDLAQVGGEADAPTHGASIAGPEGRPKRATRPIAASYRAPIALHLKIGARTI
jgi:hypothetical protein